MSSLFSGRHGIPLRRLASILSVALILPALALIAGCPDGGPSDVVSGTCMLGDEPVAGKVVFVGADAKTYFGPILEGKYKVEKAPKGTYKVYIESTALPGGAGGAVPTPKEGGAKDTKELPGAKKMGVPPPDKYKSVDTSGLTVEVKGGKQDHPIKLEAK